MAQVVWGSEPELRQFFLEELVELAVVASGEDRQGTTTGVLLLAVRCRLSSTTLGSHGLGKGLATTLLRRGVGRDFGDVVDVCLRCCGRRFAVQHAGNTRLTSALPQHQSHDFFKLFIYQHFCGIRRVLLGDL